MEFKDPLFCEIYAIPKKLFYNIWKFFVDSTCIDCDTCGSWHPLVCRRLNIGCFPSTSLISRRCKNRALVCCPPHRLASRQTDVKSIIEEFLCIQDWDCSATLSTLTATSAFTSASTSLRLSSASVQLRCDFEFGMRLRAGSLRFPPCHRPSTTRINSPKSMVAIASSSPP